MSDDGVDVSGMDFGEARMLTRDIERLTRTMEEAERKKKELEEEIKKVQEMEVILMNSIRLAQAMAILLGVAEGNVAIAAVTAGVVAGATTWDAYNLMGAY
jgi:predicted RNase H-like nuclease (RuvC/YqgF family)